MIQSPEYGSFEAPFFDSYKPELRQVFDVLGHSGDWKDTLPEMSNYMQQQWVPGDHWNPKNQEPFSDTQVVQTRELFARMGMVGEQVPPSGEYDQIVILGAMMRANNARTEFVANLMHEGRVTIAQGGKIVFWGGPRQREKKEDEPTARLLGTLGQPTHHAFQNPWLQKQLRLLSESNAERVLETEADEGRAVMLHHLGDMTLNRAYIPLATDISQLPEPGKYRDISRYDFTQSSGTKVEVINAQTVDRPMGDPRHTTEQCAKEWLETDPPAEHARVLFVSSNPYIRRTTLVVNKLIDQSGRNDIQLFSCGPAAYETTQPQLFMGEAGRLIYEDLQRAQ